VLWKLVDVLAILAAIGLLVLLGPDVIGMKRWRQRLTRSLRRTSESEPDVTRPGPAEPAEPGRR
jgi:hypothetical protein